MKLKKLYNIDACAQDKQFLKTFFSVSGKLKGTTTFTLSTLSVLTFIIATFSLTTTSIATLIIATFSLTTISITFEENDTHNKKPI